MLEREREREREHVCVCVFVFFLSSVHRYPYLNVTLQIALAFIVYLCKLSEVYRHFM
jgi:hypothetical protein